MISGDMLLVTSIITLSLTFIMLSYYLPKLIKLNKSIQEADTVIGNVMRELRRRMNNQDKKIMDQEVELEIMNLKIAKLISTAASKEYTKINRKLKVGNRIREENKLEERVVDTKEKLTDTEEEILKILSQKEYTATELQAIINKTREHTSRMLKKLFRDGYINRDERKRPYVYRLIRDDLVTFE